MKKEPNIDELLNSYIDGELTPQEQVKIEHLVAEDSQIANKLQQLQKCKILLSSLPTAKAPSKILDNIKKSLGVSETQGNHVQPLEKRTSTKFLRVRKVFAAAAMLAFAAVLAVVIRTISPTSVRDDLGVGEIVTNVEFRGTLELKTSEFAAVDSVLNRSFKNNGLMNSFTSEQEQNRRVYSLSCSGESLNRVLNDLGGVWDKLNSTKLSVNTKVFDGYIEIDTITPKQIAEIANQTDSNKTIELSRDYAVLNNIAGRSPGSEILPSIEEGIEDLIPKPIIAGPDVPAPEVEGNKTVQMRIILSR
jgi:hypothetical protein